MTNTQFSNCINCGAKLDFEANGKKCIYCGTDYSDEKISQPVKNDTISQSITGEPTTSSDKGANTGAVLIIVLVFLLIIIIAAYQGAKNQDAKYRVTDSLSVDTTTVSNRLKIDTATKPKDDTYEKRELKALSAIRVDVATFKKLYGKTRKKHDQFSRRTEIYDQSSPQYVNRNGIFAYINKEQTGTELRFCTQYYADDWLFIKQMTFNADGENFTHTPDFKTDNGDGMIWEWSDEIISAEGFDMLIKISTAKNAKVKYNGDKYYKVVNITPMQRTALKHQLQIYKGLLLRYDKSK